MELWQRRFIQAHRLPPAYPDMAERWFRPALETLLATRPGDRPLMMGIQGCQGSGKSTLAAWMDAALTEAGLTVATLSLDDFYLPRDSRADLAERVHPLLRTRGVPGTHDVGRLVNVLEHFRQGRVPVALPRFDKATDNPVPASGWPIVNTPVDVVILEGWCWGIPPEPEPALETPVNTLEANEDPDGRWRHWVNARLREDYVPLYCLMDVLLSLRAPDFACVARWRSEQEDRLREWRLARGEPVAALMSAAQIEQFVAHYERLTRHGLRVLPDIADVTWQLDGQRHIVGWQSRPHLKLPVVPDG
ncbi:hypothetical protein AAIA72_06490 [Hahella sp. SMD15-11]|uniref:Kinase n=1 Tax=Thermohahella caldifontis TaxID=3142973 RepID=A0AB39V0I5_9GAMM